MNLLKRKRLLIVLTLALFFPSIASAHGGLQPGDIFVILLPIAIILFLYINRKYFFLVFKNKKIMLLTFIPLLVIGIITVHKIIETKKELDIENQKIIECELKNDKILREQGRTTIRPCSVLTDLRSGSLDIAMFILSSLFVYSIFMMLYGVYSIKKKNDVGKKILKFSIFLVLLIIFAYVSLIMMSTVLLH